MGYPK